MFALRARMLPLAAGLALLATVAPPGPTAAPAEAAGVGAGEFVVRCDYSHSLKDDPIVRPGEPGVTHLHDFLGNTSTNANSTVASMKAAPTKCIVSADTASYWLPAVYNKGVAVPYKQPTNGDMRAYYLNNISSGRVSDIPSGLKMISGDAAATGPQPTSVVAWNCGADQTYKTPDRSRPYDCTPFKLAVADGGNGFCGSAGCDFSTGITLKFHSPRCWDGQGLEPSDMSIQTRASCLSVAGNKWLPNVSPRFHFGLMNPCYAGKPCAPDTTLDSSVSLTFSSGKYYTAHTDFWNTWNQQALSDLIALCLQPDSPAGAGNCRFLPPS